MKILYDHQIFSLQKSGGISRYFDSLGRLIPTIDPASEVYMKADWSENIFLNKKRLPILMPWRLRQLAYYGINNINSLVSSCDEIDIYHPTYYGSLFNKPSARKTVVTVFDMIHELGYTKISSLDRTVSAKKSSMERADAIIAISNSTKNDICSVYPALESKISVIYLASDLTQPASKSRTPIADSNYILYVGNRSEYKNFWPYVDSIKSLILSKHIKIVAFGGGEFSASELQAIKKYQLIDSIIHVSGDDKLLVQYYKNAIFLAYPSKIEGFGLPIIEAFTLGCPVLTSNLSSMKEIAKAGAKLVDPTDYRSMASSTNHLIENKLIRAQLVQSGLLEARNYSWKKCAEETMSLYRQLLTKKD